MLGEIESGKAQGILAWHPDRLARNSVDGGRIVYLVAPAKSKTCASPPSALSRPPTASSC